MEGVSVMVGVKVGVGVKVSVGVNVKVGVGVFVHDSAVPVNASATSVAFCSGDGAQADKRIIRRKSARYIFNATLQERR